MNPPPARLRRRLAQPERLMWAIDGACLVNGAIAVEVAGQFTVDRLRAALAAVRHRHALFAVRIDPRGPWLTTAGVPEVPVQVLDSPSAEDWTALVESELQRPFDLLAGPLVRMVAARHGTDRFELVLIGHHAVTDGTSRLLSVRDVLHHLADASVDLPPVPAEPAESCRPAVVAARRAASRPAVARPAGLTRREARQHRPAGARLSVVPGAFALSRWTLDSAGTTALLHRCRVEGTTVQAALCTAFLRAVDDLDDTRRVRFLQTPVNLRRLLDVADEAYGLYVGAVETAVDVAAGRDFWQVARDFKADLSAQVDPARLLATVRRLRLLRLVPRPLLARFGRSIRVRYDLSITNVGKVPIPMRYGSLRVLSLYGASVPIAPGHRVVGVVNVDGRLHFTLVSFERDLMERVADLAMAHLAVAVAIAVERR